MKKKNHLEIIFGVTFVPIVYFTLVLLFFAYSKIVANWSSVVSFFSKIEGFLISNFEYVSEKIGGFYHSFYEIVENIMYALITYLFS